eukprot:UN02106
MEMKGITSEGIRVNAEFFDHPQVIPMTSFMKLDMNPAHADIEASKSSRKKRQEKPQITEDGKTIIRAKAEMEVRDCVTGEYVIVEVGT